MSLVSTDPRSKRVHKLCTLWIHDDSFSKEDVIINLEKFSDLSLSSGSLARIVPLKQETAARDFESSASTVAKHRPTGTKEAEGASKGASKASSRKTRRNSVTVTPDESTGCIVSGRDLDEQRSYVFVARDTTTEQKAKHPGLQVSLTATVANVFGFRNRTQVVVSTPKTNEDSHSASHVEITFRDEYLSRADMWRLAMSELSQKTIYRDQKLLFMGTIKATVRNVYIDGQRKRSAYFSSSTKPIFRSESARYILFIQMSKEMWDFDAEGSGEIMFNKVINGFLPELFKHWMRLNARHLVSIILFTRLQYDKVSEFGQGQYMTDQRQGNATNESKDFYRVVVSDMASGDWINILYQLKREFRVFLRDVSIMRNPAFDGSSNEHRKDDGGDAFPEHIIAGSPTTASRGNVLEAINLASSQFSRDYIDRDLVRTGISVVVITAGAGVYEVDYNMLKLTTETLVGSGIGIDLVCLSPMPLHSVPLFKYQNPRPKRDADPALTPSKSDNNSSVGPKEHNSDAVPPSGLSSQPSANGVIGLAPRPMTMTSKPKPNGAAFRGLADEDSKPGEWSYAMPHWVDISFWTGPSDEVLVSRTLIHGRRHWGLKETQHKAFALRCRMYELQMMGVMENEMSNISVPYLHEDALHPWHHPRSLVSHSGSYASDSDWKVFDWQTRTLIRKWMDEYDENTFRSPDQKRIAREDARKELDSRPTKTLQRLGSKDRNWHPAPSTKDPSHGLDSPRARPGYLDWKMDRKGWTRPSIATRKESTGSVVSTAGSTISTANILSRPISFGGPGFAPQASTSTELSLGSTSVPRVTITRGKAAAGSLRAHTPSGLAQKGTPVLQRNAPLSHKLPTAVRHTKNKDESRSTEPIAISSARSSEVEVSAVLKNSANSTETLKGMTGSIKRDSARPASTEEEPSSILHIATHVPRIGSKPALSRAEDAPSVPRALSPTSALAPWLVLVNPSNPRKNNMDMASHFRRWHHVFPKPLRASAIKWKSLCSPAAVPLTNDFFPTAEQLVTEYYENPYKVSLNADDDLSETPRTRDTLIKELIALRLSHGFQLIVGPAVADFLGSKESDLGSIFDQSYMAKDGATVFMSVGNTIHQLICIVGGSIEVRRFSRKPTVALESSCKEDSSLFYRPLIKTALAKDYEFREVAFKPPKEEYNWNFIDTFLAGYHDDFSDNLRFWRARFVLIPSEMPFNARRPLPLLTEDSEEEIRLEGIKKLTQLWQRYRYAPPEERRYNAHGKKRKDPNPLAIEYQTRDPSAVIAAGLDSLLLAESDNAGLPTQIFMENEPYQTSNIDLQKLAQDLQGEKGIKMLDRRWHWRLHYNCFVGFDLTSWLLQNFRDVQTREEAVDLGNQLMKQGLFQHVQRKHQFRDGNYFYQIASEYRSPRPDSRTSWFGSRRADRSVPSTPVSEPSRGSPLPDRFRSRPGTEDSSNDSGEKTPTKEDAKQKVVLSRVMRYDVDHRKRSYRPEIINLHYDRLHNPDNCYHIRIDWMSVTAKLIEDAIVTWATLVEKYGLRLVEVPIGEASSINEVHPFRSPYIVQLAVPPPQAQPQHYFDTTSFSPHTQTDKFAYHKALLRKLDFVLDMEAASCFPSDVNVVYSWGKPDYKFTQYIHKTGVVLAQITDEGHFLLLANRLCNNRAATARDSSKFEKLENIDRRGGTGTHGPQSAARNVDRWSPYSSPLARAMPDSIGNLPTQSIGPEKTACTPEQIKDYVEAFCHDSKALRSFYDEAFKPRVSPSPQATPVMESTIPSLGLPPSISVRDVSPSPALDATRVADCDSPSAPASHVEIPHENI